MVATHLVYPMAAMVLLTVVVLVTLFRSRVAAVRAGQIDAKFFRLYQGEGEPELARKASRHFSNLFEAPVLFYVACVAAMVSHVDGIAFVSLAWAYVIARVWHAAIHLGGNRLGKRIVAYFVSWIVLVAMWVTLAIAVSRPGSAL